MRPFVHLRWCFALPLHAASLAACLPDFLPLAFSTRAFLTKLSMTRISARYAPR